MIHYDPFKSPYFNHFLELQSPMAMGQTISNSPHGQVKTTRDGKAPVELKLYIASVPWRSNNDCEGRKEDQIWTTEVRDLCV